MNREILFRARQIFDMKWGEGDLICEPDGGVYIQYCVPYSGSETCFKRYKYRADSNTVCQYTGLKDKNGKKMFEGDIISTPKYGVDNGKGQNYSGKDRFLIGYGDGTYYLENKLRKFCLRPDSTCEVIGNIFDNPELLERI